VNNHLVLEFALVLLVYENPYHISDKGVDYVKL